MRITRPLGQRLDVSQYLELVALSPTRCPYYGSADSMVTLEEGAL